MKTLITLALLAITLPSFTQTNRIFSVSIIGGTTIPLEKFADRINTGYNAGIDVETRKENFAIFGAGRINQVKAYRWNFENYGMPVMEKWTYTIGEISAGGRWYLGNSKPFSGNVDLAVSIYTGNYFQKIPWGIQPGIGGNVKITKNLSANLNLKVNIFEEEDWLTYLGLNLGLRYSLNKQFGSYIKLIIPLEKGEENLNESFSSNLT